MHGTMRTLVLLCKAHGTFGVLWAKRRVHEATCDQLCSTVHLGTSVLIHSFTLLHTPPVLVRPCSWDLWGPVSQAQSTWSNLWSIVFHSALGNQCSHAKLYFAPYSSCASTSLCTPCFYMWSYPNPCLCTQSICLIGWIRAFVQPAGGGGGWAYTCRSHWSPPVILHSNL